ncbi:HIT family protein [Candidatus Woesearchaeota archaeon]|nr:HIT family protein [Candidatus Woesearchaeota archaeon]
MNLSEKLKDAEEGLKGLSKEEQEKRVNEVLSSLSEEELEELKRQQCVFCLIIDGKIDAYDIYEDSMVKAVLDIKPANKGHVVLFPKEHYQIMSLMPDKLVEHIFKIANMLSRAVFDGVKANGTNIYVANGNVAGQISNHVLVHVIPRFNDDHIVIPWKSKEFSEEEMKNITKEIKSKIVKKEDVKKEVKIEAIAEREKRRIP